MSAAAKAINSRAHHPECLCRHCERNGTGYFAQMAALAGDESAAERLSAPVYAFLAAQRAERRGGRRSARHE
jgi:hypothetical protein